MNDWEGLGGSEDASRYLFVFGFDCRPARLYTKFSIPYPQRKLLTPSSAATLLNTIPNHSPDCITPPPSPSQHQICEVGSYELAFVKLI